nr:MAG TPA: hypothetical protein [Caudoviricetes sp.]
MDIKINEVQEIIKNLESSGELSIKEEKYLSVAKLCVHLAAENVALKAFVGECAIAQGEGNWTRDVEKTVYVPATEWMPPTPATDRIVAGIKADGVEEFSKTLEGAADICGKSKAWEAQENLLDFASRGFEFAKQLRDGGSHD